MQLPLVHALNCISCCCHWLHQILFINGACPGELPTILDGRDIIESRNVCAHIATRFDVDKALTAAERAESVAFRSLIHTQLHAAVVRENIALVTTLNRRSH